MSIAKWTAEVRARLEASTPGPWDAYNWPSFPRNDEYKRCVRIESKTKITAFCFDGKPNHDAFFIASAPADLTKALAVIEILREALDEYAVKHLAGDTARRVLAKADEVTK